jgi:cytochrome c556
MRAGIAVLIGLGIGLASGAVLTSMYLKSAYQANAYPHGVMAVFAAQAGAINSSIKQNRCSAADLIPKLQSLRVVGNDIEPAFSDYAEDQNFSKYAADFRATLDAALTAPPGNCQAATSTFNNIKAACEACHRDFAS